MLNAEVKEGEILPPTIQKLMKGYNKYLRPFFDSKETQAPMEITQSGGFTLQFSAACSLWVIYADMQTPQMIAYVYLE